MAALDRITPCVTGGKRPLCMPSPYSVCTARPCGRSAPRQWAAPAGWSSWKAVLQEHRLPLSHPYLALSQAAAAETAQAEQRVCARARERLSIYTDTCACTCTRTCTHRHVRAHMHSPAYMYLYLFSLQGVSTPARGVESTSAHTRMPGVEGGTHPYAMWRISRHMSLLSLPLQCESTTSALLSYPV